uniref:Enoyl-CoA delta isomerase 2, mitochondrial n=1 Tax=Parastrongyloides trichosuri TaxID=131310 RepID=A0A0N4ZDN7_PARTI
MLGRCPLSRVCLISFKRTTILQGVRNLSSDDKVRVGYVRNQLGLRDWISEYCNLQSQLTINSYMEYEMLKAQKELVSDNDFDFELKLPNIKLKMVKKALVITIDDTRNLNSLTPEMYEGITEALKYSLDDRNTAVTILTGEGTYFSNGNNFKNIKDFNMRKYNEIYKKFMMALIDHDKPLVGFINGPTVGIFAECLPLFDYIIATNNTYFQSIAIQNNSIPGGCSTFTYDHFAGRKFASNFIMKGNRMSAIEARNAGFVNSVVQNRFFNQACKRKISQFSKINPVNLVMMKKAFRDLIRCDLYKSLEKELEFHDTPSLQSTVLHELMHPKNE